MRILVCGDRNWTDYDMIAEALFQEAFVKFQDVTVIEGEARGADSLAARAAVDLALKVERYPAQWKKYGKAAGAIRNQQMLDEGRPDLVLAFHDDIEHSKGTKDMVRRARLAGIETRVITHG
jgi:hypothetical protein